MNRKAIIFGIKGYQLTKKEKRLLKKVKPWGIILFSRNIKSIPQLKILIYNIKKILNDKKYPILIDQEGGKVSRLNKIVNLSLFSQDFFANLYNKDSKLFQHASKKLELLDKGLAKKLQMMTFQIHTGLLKSMLCDAYH